MVETWEWRWQGCKKAGSLGRSIEDSLGKVQSGGCSWLVNGFSILAFLYFFIYWGKEDSEGIVR